MACVGRGWGLPILGTAGSTTDPLQGAAEPVSEVGGVSGKTYFRKGRRHQTEREG